MLKAVSLKRGSFFYENQFVAMTGIVEKSGKVEKGTVA
jgi:hypothetical protein